MAELTSTGRRNDSRGNHLKYPDPFILLHYSLSREVWAAPVIEPGKTKNLTNVM